MLLFSSVYLFFFSFIFFGVSKNDFKECMWAYCRGLKCKKTITIKTTDPVCVCQKIIILCTKKNINQDQAKFADDSPNVLVEAV